MNNLIPREPKRKKQPTAECYREQLALAADEIIRLRQREAALQGALRGGAISPYFYGHVPKVRQPWWRRIFPRKPHETA